MIEAVFGLLMVISSVWVYLDATKHKIGKVKEVVDNRKIVSYNSAGAWGIGTLGLWIIAFPLYLIKRKKKIELAKSYPVVVKYRNVKTIILGAIGFIWVLFSAASAAYASLPECGSYEAKETIQEIVEDSEHYGLQYVDMNETLEKGFNEEREFRVCNGTLVTASGAYDVNYNIQWIDKEDLTYEVEIID